MAENEIVDRFTTIGVDVKSFKPFVTVRGFLMSILFLKKLCIFTNYLCVEIRNNYINNNYLHSLIIHINTSLSLFNESIIGHSINLFIFSNT